MCETRAKGQWRRGAVVPLYEEKLLKTIYIYNLNFNALHRRYELTKKIINIVYYRYHIMPRGKAT